LQMEVEKCSARKLKNVALSQFGTPHGAEKYSSTHSY
jgi:hypothetical protein